MHVLNKIFFASEAGWATHMDLTLNPVRTSLCQTKDRLMRDIHVLKEGAGVRHLNF